MKKGLIALLAIIVLLAAASYIFIPQVIHSSKSIIVNATRPGLYRVIVENSDWQSWWPGTVVKEGNNPSAAYFFNDKKYETVHKTVTALDVNISDSRFTSTSHLIFLPPETDTTMLVWETNIAASLNPITRWRQYFFSKQITKDAGQILEKIKNYFSVVQNVYGINIKKDHVKDSALIFTYDSSKGFPSQAFVYRLINKLKIYAAANTAKETDNPMLNIGTTDSINYLIKVAIPVERKLPPSGNISYRWMLRGGNILIADIKGGVFTINNAVKQIENYIADYKRVSPAISYQSLITDRMKEPDSSKWVTRIFYPVM